MLQPRGCCAINLMNSTDVYFVLISLEGMLCHPYTDVRDAVLS